MALSGSKVSDFSDDEEPSALKDPLKDPPNPPKDPRSAANVLSRIFFCWINPLIFLSLRRSLEHSDLYAHPSEFDSKYLLDKFNRHWQKELARGSPRLWLALLKTLLGRMIWHHVLYFIQILAILSSSLLLGYLTEYLTNPNETAQSTAYFYVTGISVLAISSAVINSLSLHTGWLMSLHVKVIITSAIYQKVLSLSQTTVGQLTVGHVINLASNDVRLMDDAFCSVPIVPLYPVLLTATAGALYFTIGPYAFLIIAVLIGLIPLQTFLTKLYEKLRLKALRQSDYRVRVMNEVISGMRVIKMYAWEYAFKRMVDKIRNKEIYILTKAAAIHSFNLAFYTIMKTCSLFALFCVIAATGVELSPRQIFTTLTVITFVRHETASNFTYQLIRFSDLGAAMKRIQELLCIDELESSSKKAVTEMSSLVGDPDTNTKSSPMIIVDGLSASWSMDHKLVLSNISCAVNMKKPLMAVVGPVGAGKSSLLQCILRELPAMNGGVKVRGSVAYASQEAWVLSATLRENILFGLPYDSAWYNTVIEACALERDVKLLPNGDLTLVGERGVTLSGGQKARVNLARAVYRNADIYLLDDPLSAVDAAVSRHIFERCIKGLLSGQCVVLVTHQLQYVQQCDTVLILNEGKVAAWGEQSIVTNDLLGFIKEPEECTERGNPMSTQNVVTKRRETGHITQAKFKETNVRSLTEEERTHGTVSFSTYFQFFKAGGGYIFTLLAFLFFFAVEVVVVVADWWVTHLAGNHSDANGIRRVMISSDYTLTIPQWLGVYAGLTGGVILLSFIRVFLLFVLLLRATRLLHNKMFAAVLRSPVLFFDINPIGRILNRFSKDIGYMDDQLQFTFLYALVLLSYFGGVLVLAVVANPWMLITLVVVVVIFLVVRWMYVTAGRELRRLEALSRSPLYAHLSTTLQGLAVIRSYSMKSVALSQLHNYQNRNTQAWYLYLITVRWKSLIIDGISVIFLVILAFAAVPLASNLDGTLLSLSLTYTVTITYYVLACVLWASADVENYMVSTERVLAYGKLQPESSLETYPDSAKPPPDWPSKGQIELNGLTYRHSPEGPLVLKGITATILPSEKIGIVGRTGAGKSSLIATLFRLAEPGGSIKIDGLECCNLGLHDVRSKISIIPQDPVLFSGTVRYNLDPFSQYSDNDLWKALEQVQLKNVVDGLTGMLDAAVSEGGSNFSVGQRQLFCLARALLRRNNILILDEATANVDLETDAVIQNIIRTEFCEQTVMTVAHRLDTVMDSDKIMVLQAGELCEYGEPYQLLCNPNSYLLRLVEHTGPFAAQKLKNIAFSVHQNKHLTN